MFHEESLYVLVALASISFFFSFITIWIIWKMKRWNGYLFLTTHLTVAQLFYDFGLMLAPFQLHPSGIGFKVMVFIRLFGGVSTALWSNIVMIFLYYVCKTLKTFDILVNFAFLFTVVYLPAFVMGMIRVLDTTQINLENIDLINNYIRLLSITINIIIYFMILWRINKMAYNNQNDPVKKLVRRVKYYPMIQTLTRIPFSIYLLLYDSYGNHNPYANTYNDDNTQTPQIVFLYFVELTLPLTGLGFFLLFLKVSPGVRTFLRAFLRDFLVSFRLVTMPTDTEVSLKPSPVRKGKGGGGGGAKGNDTGYVHGAGSPRDSSISSFTRENIQRLSVISQTQSPLLHPLVPDPNSSRLSSSQRLSSQSIQQPPPSARNSSSQHSYRVRVTNSSQSLSQSSPSPSPQNSGNQQSFLSSLRSSFTISRNTPASPLVSPSPPPAPIDTFSNDFGTSFKEEEGLGGRIAEDEVSGQREGDVILIAQDAAQPQDIYGEGTYSESTSRSPSRTSRTSAGTLASHMSGLNRMEFMLRGCMEDSEDDSEPEDEDQGLEQGQGQGYRGDRRERGEDSFSHRQVSDSQCEDLPLALSSSYSFSLSHSHPSPRADSQSYSSYSSSPTHASPISDLLSLSPAPTSSL